MKPTVRGVFGHFKRKSSTTVARKGQRPYEPSFRDDDVPPESDIGQHASTHGEDKTSLFSLPTELHLEIFLALHYQDLCSFRAVNVRARDLLAEGEIVRQWIIQNGESQHLKLYPLESVPAFQYILDQHRRLRLATELAGLLAEYIDREILRYTRRRLSRTDVFESVKSQLRDKLIPLVLIVQHYLEHSALILLDTTANPSNEYRTMYRSQERKIFENYDPPEHLHLAHKFWMFLVWLSDQILHRPSYAGTVERTVRGWSMEPLNQFNYRLFLVFGNVDALIRLLQAGSPKQRRKMMDSWLSRLHPDRSVSWQKDWQEIAAGRGKQISKEHVKRLLSLELTAKDLWVESAEAALHAKSEIVPQDTGSIGTPQQVMDFLCDLAGYDVLHLPPSV